MRTTAPTALLPADGERELAGWLRTLAAIGFFRGNQLAGLGRQPLD